MELVITCNTLCWLDIAVVRAAVKIRSLVDIKFMRINKRKGMRDMKLWTGFGKAILSVMNLELWCFFVVLRTFAG